MKRLLAFAMILCMILALAAPVTAFADDAVTISLWICPIGKWSDEATVKGFIEAFNAIHPEITVELAYLDDSNDGDKLNTAIESGQAPDIVMAGPGQLLADWSARGMMLDLADLVPASTYEGVKSSCTGSDGKVYELPVCMTVRCMAINRNVFEAADAIQYIDLEKHTWTTENFFKAVQAVYSAGNNDVGTVFCGGQDGDQGTRALVTNLCGGTYTNPEHTRYTYASEKNAKALSLLCTQDGITFDPSLAAGDATQNFVNGISQMAFCWDAAQEISNRDALTFDVLPMAFPAPDGVPSLEGDIWGFGIFDNRDEARAKAAREFIRYLTEDDKVYAQVVEAAELQPVRDVAGIYEGSELMAAYMPMNPMTGDSCQITKGWSTARTEWRNMLQRVNESDGSEAAILAELNQAQDAANAAAAAE